MRTGLVGGIGIGVLVGAALALALLDWSGLPRVHRAARVVRAPFQFVHARATSEKPTAMVIDLKFKHLHRLHQRRNRAIAEGVLVPQPDDDVPAIVSVGGTAVPVRLRLLGPDVDRMSTPLWPLHVTVSGDGHVLGMHSLSLRPVSPTRPTLTPLFLQHALDEGLAAARHVFVSLTWNGEDRGLYAALEAPSRHLVRAAGHSSSAVIGWDADEQRAQAAARTSTERSPDHARSGESARPYDDPFTAPLAKIDGNGDVDVALGLLRGFATGRLESTDVFDAPDTARFLALAELWQLPRAARWTELALSYDPVDARLRPIVHPGHATHEGWREAPPFEAADARGSPPPPLPAAILEGALARAWLRDARIQRVFEREFERMAREVSTSKRQTWAQRAFDVVRQHHRAHPFSRVPDLESVLRRASHSAHRRTDVAAALASATPLVAPLRSVVAADLRDGVRGRIELAAGGATNVAVATLGTQDEATWIPLLLSEAPDFPLLLDAAPAGTPRLVREVRYRLPVAIANVGIFGRARVAGREGDVTFAVPPGVPALREAPLATGRLDEALRRHSFLSVIETNGNARRVRIVAGEWKIDGTLALPDDVTLVIEAGAHLRFEPERGLLVRGGLRVEGTPERPVIFSGLGDDPAAPPWGGIAVVSDHAAVRLRELQVLGAGSLRRRDWRSDASVLVRAPRFEASRLRIVGSDARAALALDRTSAALSGVVVRDAGGDAIRATHSRVAADDVHALRVDGRGWSQRGGQASLRNALFESVGDAGLEIDEAGGLEVTALAVDSAGVGLVARGGARVALHGGSIERAAHAALLCFSGAAGWGPASIEADGLRMDGPGDAAIAQRGSRIALDGQPVAPVDLDFAGLRRGS